MKRTIITLLNVLFCALIFAQTIPQGINYQAVARDVNGDELTNQSLNVKLSVILGSTAGTISWQETHLVTTNNFGLFTAVIGQGTSTSAGSSATFNVVDWGSASHYLKVEIDAGSGFVDMGTNQLLSVPYALQAGNPDPLVSGSSGQTLRHDGNDWVSNSNLYNNGNNVGIGITSSMSGRLHAKSNIATWSNFFGVGYNNAIYGEVIGSEFSSRGVAGISWGSGTYGIGVYGSANGAATSNYGVYGIATGGTNNFAGFFDDGNVYIENNLGIGTTSPLYNLDVSGNINFSGNLYKNGFLFEGADNLGNHIATQILDLDTNDIRGIRYLGFKRGNQANNINTNNDGQLIFSVNDDNGGTQVMTIDDDSYNVGIGTSSPDEDLVVGDPLGLGSVYKAITVGANSNGGMVVVGQNNTNFMRIEYGNSFGARIKATGDLYLDCSNVGLGTNSPDVKLHVYGSTDANLNSGSGLLLIGRTNDKNIVIDDNEIIARDNGVGATLWLSREVSSDVAIGNNDCPIGYKLSVDGKVMCEELRVELSGSWPDYVFAKGYDLMSLTELEKYTQNTHHLPGIPAANQMEESGISMGEMTTVLMTKVEELTLYLIEANKNQIKANKRIEQLEEQVKQIKK